MKHQLSSLHVDGNEIFIEYGKFLKLPSGESFGVFFRLLTNLTSTLFLMFSIVFPKKGVVHQLEIHSLHSRGSVVFSSMMYFVGFVSYKLHTYICRLPVQSDLRSLRFLPEFLFQSSAFLDLSITQAQRLSPSMQHPRPIQERSNTRQGRAHNSQDSLNPSNTSASRKAS